MYTVKLQWLVCHIYIKHAVESLENYCQCSRYQYTCLISFSKHMLFTQSIPLFHGRLNIIHIIFSRSSAIINSQWLKLPIVAKTTYSGSNYL